MKINLFFPHLILYMGRCVCVIVWGKLMVWLTICKPKWYLLTIFNKLKIVVTENILQSFTLAIPIR